MISQYYLDLEKYTLQKFKISIQNREMIPSRAILKDNTEEKFKILNSYGIDNLKILIDTLKTKEKVKTFSDKTNLSVEYLTVLKREANSFLPKPINLNKFAGIDNDTIEVLKNIGIRNTRQFYNEVSFGKDTYSLFQKTGISKEKLNELKSLSDLARLYGVGPVFAEIIYNVGIRSVEGFITHSADEFVKIYEEKTKRKADFGESDISLSIELAKELVANKT